jgi:hypothetical protein
MVEYVCSMVKICDDLKASNEILMVLRFKDIEHLGRR